MHIPRNIRAGIALGASAFALSTAVASAAPTDLDPSFGEQGKVTIAGKNNQIANDLDVQPDGRIVGAGSSNGDVLAFRLGTGGAPDDPFGVKELDAGDLEGAYALAIQPDGKVVLAGTTTKNYDGAVLRLGADGTPDMSFDGDGRVTIDSSGMESLNDVAIQPDGKIVVVGSTTVGNDMAIYRLDSEGKLDQTFDGDGAVGYGGPGLDVANAVAVQPDGKILVTGYSFSVPGAPVYRLKDDGSLDKTFDGDGLIDVGSAISARGNDLLVQPDGKIVVAGQAYGAQDYDAFVTRLTPTGAPDPDFRDTGTVLVDDGSDEEAGSVAQQPDGKLLLGGGTSAGNDALLARLSTDGSRDRTFTPTGVFTFSGGGLETVEDVALQTDGKFLVAGDNSANDSDAVVYRFKGDSVDRVDPGGKPDDPGDKPDDPDNTPPPPPVVCAGKIATIVGTASGDRITATPGRDVIAGLGGRDVIAGLAGNDVVCGGKGKDVLRGGKGRDVLIGGAGKDRLIGGPGKDRTQQ